MWSQRGQGRVDAWAAMLGRQVLMPLPLGPVTFTPSHMCTNCSIYLGIQALSRTGRSAPAPLPAWDIASGQPASHCLQERGPRTQWDTLSPILLFQCFLFKPKVAPLQLVFWIAWNPVGSLCPRSMYLAGVSQKAPNKFNSTAQPPELKASWGKSKEIYIACL